MENNNSIDEQAIEDFETAWTAAPFPNIDDFLPDSSGDTFLGTLLELVIIDLEFRWKQVGATIDVGANHVPDQLEQYIARYPQLTDDETIRRLAEEEFAIRRKYGDQPSAASFLRRFPQLRERIEQLDTQYPLTEVRRPTVRKRVSQPSTIEHYELHQVVGEGGMGSVYLAHQKEPVRRQVAVKVIRAGFDSHDVIARFEAERQALAMMDHQHIARVYDAGTTDQGLPFLTMEYVDGIPITDYCSRNKLSVPDRLHLFKDVCSAVQHAHQKGVLHRDLKPSNVLIAEEDGRPVAKVIDFGLAKAVDAANLLTDKTIYTHAGQVLGTLKYMSPEQAATHEEDVDTRADVYALGVMLYELLTGETPLDEASIREQGVLSVLEMIRDHEPVRPSARLALDELSSQDISAELGTSASALRQVLRGDLDWVVMKALEKDRERRYESASSLADDVRRFLSNEPVQARPPSTSYRLKKFARKNRVLVTSGLAMLILLIAGIAATSWQAYRATNAESDANEQKGIAVANAAESEQRRVEAETARDEAKQSAKRAEDALQLLVDSFQATDPIEGGKDGMSATDVLNVTLQKLDQQAGIDSTSRALLLKTLSESFRGLGDLEKAKATATKAIQICRDHPKADNHLLVSVMTSLALAHAFSGQTDEAIRIEREILQVLEQTKAGEHLGIDIARTNHYIGLFVGLSGRPDEGIKLLEPALAYLERELGSEDRWTLVAKTSLAQVYVAAGYSDKALPLLEEAFVVSEKTSGPNNPQTLRVMDNLATCHRSLGNYDRAIEIHEDAFERCHNVLQPHHRATLFYQENLGSTYQAAGHLSKAIETLTPLAAYYLDQFESDNAIRVFEQLVSIQIEQSKVSTLKPGSSDAPVDVLNRAEELGRLKALWFNQSTLSKCYEGTNRWRESVEQLRAALEGRSSYLGDKAPTAQGTRLALSRALCAAQQPREAAKILDAYNSFCDPSRDFQYLRPGLQQLVTISLWLNDSEAALRRLEDYKSIHPDDFGNGGNWRTRTLVASALAAAGRFEDAASECAAIIQSADRLPYNLLSPLDRARCSSILALCSARQTATDNSASQAIEALQVLKSQLGKIAYSDYWCIVRACERIIEIYEIAKNTNKAEVWRVQLAELKKQLRFPGASSEGNHKAAEAKSPSE